MYLGGSEEMSEKLLQFILSHALQVKLMCLSRVG